MPSTTGIQLNSGNLVLVNSTLKMLTTGLSVSSTHAVLINVNVVGNTTGISTTGTGVNTNNFPYTGPTHVDLFFGSAVSNTTAYLMNSPGANSVSILEFLTSNTTAAYSTSLSLNGTLVNITGTGGGCSPNCQLGNFSSNTNPN